MIADYKVFFKNLDFGIQKFWILTLWKNSNQKDKCINHQLNHPEVFLLKKTKQNVSRLSLKNTVKPKA